MGTRKEYIRVYYVVDCCSPCWNYICANVQHFVSGFSINTNTHNWLHCKKQEQTREVNISSQVSHRYEHIRLIAL